MVYAINFADKTVNPIAGISNLGSIINVLTPILMVGAGLVFLVMLVIGAFTWITSGGTPENMKKAQGILTSAAIGLVIVLCSYLIVKLLGYVFNIEMII
ncbi:hypothetical protein A2334_00425 [Candidatus Roizmanbacteria bacterium RIFOXYB2_FULL_38_10]|uniref:Uncharacterized protein n=1 Tax=Candidatus Roizmanbacteria bacterium RIFOXYD1_FULL_38_12 TaxID=1802093 RepID=A0A1F7L2G0_9BACT|nr:MAG: hypothetical protein A3K47_05970 [Candidatus Roizmanbacteria bacterium RIFOXYA2_FULL_38_14]OGK64286.1 MAG: hypothetical protein A3K27_05970 [Candidatus Roizmanbacteria bacterium RIFOXYA1_FULL_37_12]OGK66132.1 MAG: hypothetical protein A3K38_05970 [Candidatus Roizmanbacteria bacterium RIFOXYB1_FULL_40_23]OGK67697.1 MAG: hypothetical protein A2334_00425 [Candidatus Roizmanbacteria bacterium RIFOXYB2_FULL_38_10]OGK70537.1 MAG: hypothetical protein A3K21_05975 [Candidatus Roizmanbacteria ba